MQTNRCCLLLPEKTIVVDNDLFSVQIDCAIEVPRYWGNPAAQKQAYFALFIESFINPSMKKNLWPAVFPNFHLKFIAAVDWKYSIGALFTCMINFRKYMAGKGVQSYFFFSACNFFFKKFAISSTE